MSLTVYALGFVAVLGLATLTWVVSLVKRDVSIVDAVWSLMLLAAALVYTAGAGLYTGRTALVLVLVTLWALRLSIFITWRSWGEPEDRRYRDIREKYEPNFSLKSLGIVFAFQGLLAWVISMPLWAALTVRASFSGFDVLAVGLWTAGMVLETVADWQLARFKANPANRGQVMDRGLWRYTRHPNYFGECILWWGLYLFAIPTGAWWTIVSPLLLTYLLLKFSGVALLESTIVDRRPGYRAYMARTNAFIPGPRKSPKPESSTQGQASR